MVQSDKEPIVRLIPMTEKERDAEKMAPVNQRTDLSEAERQQLQTRLDQIRNAIENRTSNH